MKVFLRLAALCLIMGSALLPTTTFSQTEAGQAGTTELVQTARQLLSENRYGAVTSYLEELLERLEEVESDSVNSTRAFARFSLGKAYFINRNKENAVTNLNLYLANHPDDMNWVAANFFLAEMEAAEKKWAEVGKRAAAILRHEKAKPAENVLARRLAGEAAFRQKKWDEAIPFLQETIQRTSEEKVRNAAATMLVTSLIHTKQFDKLFSFMPYVNNSGAKYDVAMNIALIQGGAQLYESGNYLQALMLYRQAYLRAELIKRTETQIDALNTKLALKYDQATEKYETFKSRQLEIPREIERINLELDQLKKLPDYDLVITQRIALSYQKMRRFWEAYFLYDNLYQIAGDTEMADQALYLSYGALKDMKLEDAASERSAKYLATFPNGQFRPILVVSTIREYMKKAGDNPKQKEEWLNKAIQMSNTSLGSKAEAEARAEQKYLGAFCYFQKQEHQNAFDAFGVAFDQNPTGPFSETCTYWRAMCKLFLGDFKSANPIFQKILDEYPNGQFAEESLYRTGVCYYGLGNSAQALERFGRYITEYPGTDLESEALSMRADIYAAEGKLDEAQADYKKAITVAVEQPQINYPTFRLAEMFEMESRYDEIKALMQNYMDQYGADGKFADATYWMGKVYKQEGKWDLALDSYMKTLLQFGDIIENFGVDMIADEVIKSRTEVPSEEIWNEFMAALGKGALEAENKTLSLRLKTLNAVLLGTEAEDIFADEVLADTTNVDTAPPIVLAFMARKASERKQYDLVNTIYDRFMESFEEASQVLAAFKAKTEALMAAGSYDEAASMVNDEALARFGYVADTGWAVKYLGDVHRHKSEFKEAIAEYKTVVQTRMWRGDLSTESLYWMGRCYFEQAEYKKAHGFFQRLYVMYGGYPEWAAKSYLGSAECLIKLERPADAAQTYTKMLQQEILKGRPELETARKALATLPAVPTETAGNE